MSIFGRRPKPEAVATQLIEGLENGTLTLDDPPVGSPEILTAPAALDARPGVEEKPQVEPKGNANAPAPPKPELTTGGS